MPANFVAASGLLGTTLAPARGGRRVGAAHDAALRAAWSASPPLAVSFAITLAGHAMVLPVSSVRALWLWLAAVALLSWGCVLVAGSRRGALCRPQRAPQVFPALTLACLLLLALPPWLAGTAVAPIGRTFLLLMTTTVALAGATAFASLRVPLLACVALPLSPLLAEMARGGSARIALGGVLLALATGLVALLQRRRWLGAARVDAQCVERVRELEAARDAAQRSDQEKSRFLAIASHDLRQPMHALGLFAATLEKRLQGSGEEPLVHNLVRSIDGLDRSFNVMLDISRLEAGTVEPNLQQFSLRDLFRRLHMHFAGQAEQRGLGLRFSPGGKSLTSDPQLLERILGNLIQNAIKYTEQGGIVVVARTTRDYLNVEVWDTGAGIAVGELPRIFDEFYQVGRGARARERGFGMGLAIVKRLALLLGHRLEVASRPGRGTMFRIGIALGGLPDIQDVTAAADTLPMPQSASQPRTVLIVEDEAAIREGLGLLLEEWG